MSGVSKNVGIMKKAIILTVFLIVFASSIFLKNSNAEMTINLEDSIKNAISNHYGISRENIVVTTITTASFPLQGRQLIASKAMDGITGQLYDIGLDDQNQIVDLALLESKEIELQKERYGNIEPGLYDKLMQMQDNEKLEVIIWLKGDDAKPILTPTAEEVNEKGPAAIQGEYKVRLEIRNQKISAITNPFVDRLNKEYGTGNALSMIPGLSATLSKKAILTVSKFPEVDKVYLTGKVRPALNQSSYAIKAQVAWGINRLNTGSGMVAIVENEPVATWNPNMPDVSVVGWNWQGCYGTDGYHATYVAGVVDSHDYNSTDHFGISYGASIVSTPFCGKTGTDEEKIAAATSDAINQGAHVINNSWIIPPDFPATSTAIQRYHDTIAKSNRVTVVDAAGNCDPDCNVQSPATGYNVIAVGAFDDKNTGDNNSDDTMASFSSYIDPISIYNDREKPEVVAPGVGIETTNDTWPWIGDPPGVDGTSFATPHVSGAANILMQTNTWLQTWPEALKAILMTSTLNIEGEAKLSEYDGAGAINLGSAYYLALNNSNNRKWYAWTLTPSSFNSFGIYGPLYFYAYKGQRVRAAISWAADPNYSGYPNRPGIDLDLSVSTPSCSGSCVAYATSTSYDNNYEMVDFTASVSGWWRVYILKRSFYSADTTIGIAWSSLNY